VHCVRPPRWEAQDVFKRCSQEVGFHTPSEPLTGLSLRDLGARAAGDGGGDTTARAPGKSEAFELLGFRVTCVHADRQGRFSLLRWDAPAGAGGIQMHFHSHTEEGFYVLAGELGLSLDGQEVVCGPGAYTAVAPGQHHSFWNPGTNPAAYLTPIAPGGFENYLRALAAGLHQTRSDQQAAALRQELSEAYDIVVVGPPPLRDNTNNRTPGD
jgi:mannose-6-phosphate isomerase-like protein (cupin superfamily)